MNHCARLFLLAVLLSIGLAAAGQTTGAAKSSSAKPEASSGSSLPTEATVSSFLKQTFGWNPDLSWKVDEIKPSASSGLSQAVVVFNTPKGPQVVKIFVTTDQKYAFMAEPLPFGADPFAPMRQQLKAANGPVHGPQDAPVTIVEFGDLECPACKAAQPNITRLMEDEPRVKLIYQNYPLEQIHKWALVAAKYLDCMGRENNTAVWKFIATVYEHQGEINEQNVETMLKGYVKSSGGDPDAVAACVAKPETEKRVRDSIALAQALDVTSTPTFFINGRRVVGFSNASNEYDAVKMMVDFDLINSK